MSDPWLFCGCQWFCSLGCAHWAANNNHKVIIYANYPRKVATDHVLNGREWAHRCASCTQPLYRYGIAFLDRIIVDAYWCGPEWANCDNCANLEKHWKDGKRCIAGQQDLKFCKWFCAGIPTEVADGSAVNFGYTHQDWSKIADYYGGAPGLGKRA